MDKAPDIFLAIGKMSEAIDGLRRDVGGLRQTFEGSEKTATDHRRSIHDRINDMSERLVTVENSVTHVGDTLTNDVMPTVGKVKIWEQRGIGFLAAAGMVGTGFGATMAAFAWYYWDHFMRLLRSL